MLVSVLTTPSGLLRYPGVDGLPQRDGRTTYIQRQDALYQVLLVRAMRRKWDARWPRGAYDSHGVSLVRHFGEFTGF